MKSHNNFKEEYIKELINAGYSKEDAEEQYQLELKDINKMTLTFDDIDNEEDIYEEYDDHFVEQDF